MVPFHLEPTFRFTKKAIKNLWAHFLSHSFVISHTMEPGGQVSADKCCFVTQCQIDCRSTQIVVHLHMIGIFIRISIGQSFRINGHLTIRLNDDDHTLVVLSTKALCFHFMLFIRTHIQWLSSIKNKTFKHLSETKNLCDLFLVILSKHDKLMVLY